MKIDIRTEAPKYYDSNPGFLNDIPFYRERIPSPASSLLELGCGTGRVTLALVPYCQFIQGVDLSPAMIAICREKLILEHGFVILERWGGYEGEGYGEGPELVIRFGESKSL